MPLGNAKTLKKVFDLLCPFEKDGTLKSEENRKALLASNANIPLDVEMKGFVMASCTGGGSPQLVQISYNTAKDTGNDLKKIKAPEGVKRNPLAIRPAAIGAKRCADMLNWLTDDFDAQLVFMTLDHFSSPKFDFNACRDCQGSGGVNRYEAKARIEEAIEVMKPIFGKEVEINQETIDAYVNYMAGDGLGAFRKDFIGAVMLGNPAWAMIDTGMLPPVLNFAISKEIVERVRKDLDNKDVLIEAEFSATGFSGGEEGYQKLTGAALENFKNRVVLFVKYIGGDGVAYEIGMEHAAKKGEVHEPDIQRLEVVQRALFLEGGRYIPFAQHGGTGAAHLAKGLVGKNNINTRYLVNEANFFADHYEANKEGVRAGLKNACGAGIYHNMALSVAQSCIEKMKETGTYGMTPELLKAL